MKTCLPLVSLETKAVAIPVEELIKLERFRSKWFWVLNKQLCLATLKELRNIRVLVLMIILRLCVMVEKGLVKWKKKKQLQRQKWTSRSGYWACLKIMWAFPAQVWMLQVYIIFIFYFLFKSNIFKEIVSINHIFFFFFWQKINPIFTKTSNLSCCLLGYTSEA